MKIAIKKIAINKSNKSDSAIRKDIMQDAWDMFKYDNENGLSFSACLKQAWADWKSYTEITPNKFTDKAIAVNQGNEYLWFPKAVCVKTNNGWAVPNNIFNSAVKQAWFSVNF